MGTILQDLRYAFRMLAKSPGFTAIAVLTLALGIGTNTAIFSLIDGVIRKMLPVDHPEQIVQLVRNAPTSLGQEITFSYPQYEQFRDTSVFAGIFVATGARVNAIVNGNAEVASTQLVSGDYFSTLGVKAIVGRTFTADDDSPGAAPVAVVTYGYWSRRFGLDRSIQGKSVVLNGTQFTIVGVTPPGFFGTSPGVSPDLWIPVNLEAMVMPGRPWLKNFDEMRLVVLARLKPGVSRDQGEAILSVLFDRMKAEMLARASPEERTFTSQSRFALVPGGTGYSWVRHRFSKSLFILMAVVGLVLLITCANVAGLLLARATARQKEFSVRLAMGASRVRLFRQLLTESVLLALCGGAFGLLLANWTKSLLLMFVPGGPVQILITLPVDAWVLVFTAGASMLTGILFGVAPAFRATRSDLASALKQNAGSFGAAPTRFSLSKFFIVAQVALSVVLLVGASLLVRTLVNLETLHLGFDPSGVLLFSIDDRLAGYKGDELNRFCEQFRQQLEAIPEVRSASLSRAKPLDGITWPDTMSAAGPASGSEAGPLVMRNWVGPDYFKTLGTPLLLGREFTHSDIRGAPRVAIVNQTIARTLLSGPAVLGRRIGLYSEPGVTFEVVGVVEDSRYDSVWAEPPPLVYTPFSQSETGDMTFEVRTAGNPIDIVDAVKRTAKAVGKNAPVSDVTTFAEWVEVSLGQPRLMALLLSFFSALALLLVAVGLYGVMAHAVTRRTGEIGIRMAMGAEPSDVLGMVIAEALKLVLAGIIIGVPAALAATRLIASFLFGLGPNDPVTILMATLLMVAVAALAAYLPASRAARVDPMVALRYE